MRNERDFQRRHHGGVRRNEYNFAWTIWWNVCIFCVRKRRRKCFFESEVFLKKVIVLKLVKVSQTTAQKRQMKTSHLGQFTFRFAHRNCGWTSPRRNWRVRFIQTSVWWWYRWLHCFRNEAIRATEEKQKRERDIACNARRTKKKDCWWSSERDSACIVQISLLSSLSQWTLLILEHFFWNILYIVKILLNDIMYFWCIRICPINIAIVMAPNSKCLLQNQISGVIVLVQKVKFVRFYAWI